MSGSRPPEGTREAKTGSEVQMAPLPALEEMGRGSTPRWPPSGATPRQPRATLSETEVDLMDSIAEEQREADAAEEQSRRWCHMATEAAALLIFVFGGTGFYMSYEGWSFVDALYFVTVTTSAVGYGDLAPTDSLSRVFTVCYVFLGVTLLAASLGTWSAMITQKMTNITYTGGEPGCFGQLETRRLLTSLVLFSLAIVLGTCFYGAHGLGAGAERSYVDGLYLSAMTLTTVGYGDLSPQSHGARLFTVFYVVFGVAIFANCIQVVVTAYIRCEIKRRQDKLLARRLTHKEIQRYGGADGKLDRCEFTLVKLVQQGKVSHREIADCYRQFQQTDTDDSGFIDADDLLLPSPPDRISTRHSEQMQKDLEAFAQLAKEAEAQGVLEPQSTDNSF